VAAAAHMVKMNRAFQRRNGQGTALAPPGQAGTGSDLTGWELGGKGGVIRDSNQGDGVARAMGMPLSQTRPALGIEVLSLPEEGAAQGRAAGADAGTDAQSAALAVDDGFRPGPCHKLQTQDPRATSSGGGQSVDVTEVSTNHRARSGLGAISRARRILAACRNRPPSR